MPVRRHGPWELAVLALLREAPMHPYDIQRLLRERRKDEILTLKRGSLYHAIDRLRRAGLIRVVGTSRGGRRPERTTYALAAAGERYLLEWLQEMTAIPRTDAPGFMTCLSFLVHLTPAQAAGRLEERAGRLDQEIAALRTRIDSALPRATRVNLLESEYLLAMRKAERAWVRDLARDLRSHALTWRPRAVLASAHRAARRTPR